MNEKQVTVIAYFTVQPGSEHLFLDRLPAIVRQTRAEPGCINYDFHQNMVEQHRFVFYENYVDQAAFDTHLHSPYIEEWVQYVRLNGGRFDVEHWSMLTEWQCA